MTDEDVGSVESVVEGHEDDHRDARTRIVAILILLLLLLMCVVTTGVDVLFEKAPMTTRTTLKNVACLVCHTELIPDYSRVAVHNPFLTKSCTSCHTPHGKRKETTFIGGGRTKWEGYDTALEWLPLRLIFQAYEGVVGMVDREGERGVVKVETTKVKGPTSYLVAPKTELCWTCHGDLGPQKHMSYEHPPFDQGHCTNCHDPHASDFRVLLVMDERDLCVTCHPVAREMARTQLHPPFKGRFCTNCHHPHASDHKGILVDNQRDLCFMCHPTVARLSLKAVQHQPFAYDNCTGCHEPHGADVRPLLVEEQPPLCYRCHPGIREDFRKPSHHPVGLQLGCADCHNPHASDYEALIVAKDNALCYECHSAAIAATYERSAHRPLLCIRCHTPHGSSWAPMLRDLNPDLCLRCHPRYEGVNKHPVRPVAKQRKKNGVYIATVASNRALTCTSSCHKPHGTYNPRMLTTAYRADGLCLRCHAVVGRYF